MCAATAQADTRRAALITGASAGIGAAFAHAYAARGHDVLLVARREARLRSLAEQLRVRYSIRTETMTADLADPAAPRMIRKLVELRGLSIDVLVNNAGYGVPGTFIANDWRVHADALQVMLGSAIELTHLFAADMRARRYGRIINVASLAGLMPGSAGHTLYAPIKSALIKFSEGLAFELRPEGVNVCAVCPGFTYSEFHDVAGTRARVSRLPSILWMSAERVVEQGVRAVERGDVVYINGVANQTLALLERWLPRWVVYRILARGGRYYRNID